MRRRTFMILSQTDNLLPGAYFSFKWPLKSSLLQASATNSCKFFAPYAPSMSPLICANICPSCFVTGCDGLEIMWDKPAWDISCKIS